MQTIFKEDVEANKGQSSQRSEDGEGAEETIER